MSSVPDAKSVYQDKREGNYAEKNQHEPHRKKRKHNWQNDESRGFNLKPPARIPAANGKNDSTGATRWHVEWNTKYVIELTHQRTKIQPQTTPERKDRRR